MADLIGVNETWGSIRAKLNAALPYVSETEAQALIAKMSAQPTAARQTAMNALIANAKLYGILSKLGWLSIPGAHEEQAGRLNWVDPTKSLTAVNSPAFTIDRGFQGDGATSYLTTGIANNAFPQFSQNNGFMGVVTLTDVANSNMFDVAGGNNYINARSGSNLFVARAMFGSGVGGAQSIAAPNSIGFSWWSRLSSTEFYMGKDAAAPTLQTMGTETLSSAAIEIGRSGANYSTRQVAAVVIGAGLTPTEVANFYTYCLYPYLHTTLGAL